MMIDIKKLLLLGLCSTLLSACDGGNNSGNSAEPEPEPALNAIFELSVTNLTAGQPLSHVAALVHSADERLFEIGTAASSELELLAETGDNSDILALSVVQAQASGDSPLPPGAEETLTIELADDVTDGLAITVLSMLVNTNDAFTGRSGIDISALEVGGSVQMTGRSYDAGTELNTEAADDIPEPAGDGEGFNATRDDVADVVTGHPEW